MNTLFALAIKFCKTGDSSSTVGNRIFDEVLALANKTDGKANLIFNIGSSALNVFSDLKGRELLEKSDKNIVFILDDLERISDSIDITDLLGTIHTKFIENGVKVIFVADENKIKMKDEFTKEKEKYIQRTHSFCNDKNEVFASFLKPLNLKESESNDFLGILHQVFPEEQVNLRTVKFCLESYNDIKIYYEKQLSSNDYNSAASLFCTICNIGKFYKNGHADKNRLDSVLQTYFYKSYLQNQDEKKDDYDKFAEEYGSKLIRRKFILDLIYDGILNKEEVEFFLRKVKRIEDPIDKLFNIVELEFAELKIILEQIIENLKSKRYTIRQNASLQQQFMPYAIKMNLLTEKECINLIADSVFSKENEAELFETFDYWLKDEFSRMKNPKNDFERELEKRFTTYKTKHDASDLEDFVDGIKNCKADVFENPFRYTIFSELSKNGCFEKILSESNKAIRFFAAYISSAIVHVINANEFYADEVAALKELATACEEKIESVDKDDFLRKGALQYLKQIVNQAVYHIEQEPFQK